MYRAPLEDIRFILHELIGRPAGSDEDFPEVANSILEEAGRFAAEVLAPLNRVGDVERARWTPEGVVAPPGFGEAYRKFVEAGWPQLRASPEYGGQGMSVMLSTAVDELWAGANLAFKLCPMLTQGVVHTLELCGTPQQRQLYLPKLVSGQWTGTMVLTEPQAGSDLSQVRTRAVPEGDHYRIFGQKIFITWGEHDMAENIIHMVLARIDGAPAGTRGLSLFLVPRILVNADGSLGARNDVRCASIEHKLGIHGSPTCVMMYGERDGAIGYLVDEPNRGLERMFIMMNAARLSVGLEGYAVAERARQQALEWARNRVQGRAADSREPGPVAIVHHEDVRRMLLAMKASTEAMRALSLYAASQIDASNHHPDEEARKAAKARCDLLIPVVKGWCTELGNEVAWTGVQVHGGMGFIEETGAAQYMRDVRITAIYEGTTGIQANDLLGRKIGRDGGAAMRALLAEMRQELESLQGGGGVHAVRRAALEGVSLLQAATESQLRALQQSPAHARAVAVPYLKLCGYVVGGWLMARAAAIASNKAGQPGGEFYASKLCTARFYAGHLLPRAAALARIVQEGGASVADTDPALL